MFRISLYALLVVSLVQMLNAQTCLTLSTVSVARGTPATLDLWLTSTSEKLPAALQWTLPFPSAQIASLTVEEGSGATGAGKIVTCAPGADGYTCLAVGVNSQTIRDGVIARVVVTLAPGATDLVLPILRPLVVSPGGDYMPVKSVSGIVTNARVSPDRRLRPPLIRISRPRCD